jgi:hypothetical protein
VDLGRLAGKCRLGCGGRIRRGHGCLCRGRFGFRIPLRVRNRLGILGRPAPGFGPLRDGAGR